MAIAATASSSSMRHVPVTSGTLFCRLSAQTVGMEAAALCHRAHWVPTSSRSTCSNCRRRFRLLWAGKHHCRLCGEIVCGACSTKRILFQSKSVRTCNDCVDAKVKNMATSHRRQSLPDFLHTTTSPVACQGTKVYERRSLQPLPLRPTSQRVLYRHLSFEASAMPSFRSSNKATTSSYTNMTGMGHMQVVLLLVAALLVAIFCAL